MGYQNVIKKNAVPQWLLFYVNYELLKNIILPYILTFKGK